MADITTTLRSGLFGRISLRSPKRMSVERVLSWASSSTTIPYLLNMGSIIDSLNSIPSVRYFSLVAGVVLSSNLMVYPTVYPN